MNGLMQPGPTLYEAEQLRKKKGSRGLLGAIGEPMSYAPGPVGLLGNAMLGAQYLTGEKAPEEGAEALAMMTGLLQGTKVAPIMRNAIKVYHGSPHKFDKPDSSKIGTGEGAQAYGHGLYWAENPATASQYKKAGTDIVAQYQYELSNVPKRRLTVYEGDATSKIARYGFDGARESMRQAKALSPKWTEEYDKTLEAIDRLEKEGMKAKEIIGNLYEASLRWPDPAREAADPLSAKHFLDWDKPLSEQSEAVKSAFKKFHANKLGYEQVHDAVIDAPVWRKGKRTIGSSDLNKGAGGIPESVSGHDAHTIFNMFFGGSKSTAEKLKRSGIPGITYLDAGSRAAGQGTRNYVTFDDALVELLKRNGGLLGK